jgi:hypothetical protein
MILVSSPFSGRKIPRSDSLVGLPAVETRMVVCAHLTVRGILMHSSLAVTLDGLPMGLTAIKFWTRKQFKGCNALKRKVNPTRVPIAEKESLRWLENLRQSTTLANHPRDCVHIGDRESDIYELFCLANELGTNFLVRTCVNRLAEDGGCTITERLKQASVKGTHRIRARNKAGEYYEAELEIKYEQLQVLPPIGVTNLIGVIVFAELGS